MTIDGVVEHSTKNSDPEEFSEVAVYASDPWNLHQPSHIRALTIQTIMVLWNLFYTFMSFLLLVPRTDHDTVMHFSVALVVVNTFES